MNRETLLKLSIGLNAGLCVLVLWLIKPGDEVTPVVQEPDRSPPARAVNGEKEAAPAASPVVVGRAFDWRMVESADYLEYIANLRAIGCPEETIRDIIVADVNKLYESRLKEIQPERPKFEYWKTGMNPLLNAMPDEQALAKRQELLREKRELLKTLLGEYVDEGFDLAAMMGGMNPFETMLDFLTPEQQTRLMELEQKYGVRMAKLAGGGASDPEDMKALVELQREKDAELAAMLSPKEKLEYDLRMSITANMMRMQLDGFDPTEDEFLRVFQERKKFDDQFGGPFGMAMQDEDSRAQRTAAEKELNERIQSILGEDRYAHYERVQDFDYKSLARVAERQGLTDEAAIQAYEMKQVAQEEINRLRADGSLTAEQRQVAREAVRAETERAFTEVLGSEGFDSYQKQPSAYWLRNLAPGEGGPAPTESVVPIEMETVVIPSP